MQLPSPFFPAAPFSALSSLFASIIERYHQELTNIPSTTYLTLKGLSSQSSLMKQILKRTKQNQLKVHLESCNIPPKLLQLMDQCYVTVKEEIPFQNHAFSRADFMLAFMSWLYQIPIVSYDNHFSGVISHFLDYQVCLPEEILHSTKSIPLLCDANIVISWLLNNPKKGSCGNLAQIRALLGSEQFVLIVPPFIEIEINHILNQKLSFRTKSKGKPVNITHSSPSRRYTSPQWVPSELGRHYV